MNDEIMKKLRAFICSQFLNDPAYPLGDREALITGGLIDSFSLAQIGVFIENEFGIYIPDTDLTVDNMDTLSQIAACVESRQHD
ncbi:MAG: acyl carrier protein [Anaerolineaceae bacterium]